MFYTNVSALSVLKRTTCIFINYDIVLFSDIVFNFISLPTSI